MRRTSALRANILEMDPEVFERLLDEAIDQLPDEFRQALDNVDIAVQDWPDRQQMKEMRLRDRHELLGLYQGTPLIERGEGYNMALPDTIILFRKPIEEQCHSDEEVRQAVVETLQHEIAHHFGTPEGRLRAIERRRRKRH